MREMEAYKTASKRMQVSGGEEQAAVDKHKIIVAFPPQVWFLWVFFSAIL